MEKSGKRELKENKTEINVTNMDLETCGTLMKVVACTRRERVPEGEEKNNRVGKIFEERMVRHFFHLRKDILTNSRSLVNLKQYKQAHSQTAENQTPK
jgi:hypothetical protein